MMYRKPPRRGRSLNIKRFMTVLVSIAICLAAVIFIGSKLLPLKDIISAISPASTAQQQKPSSATPEATQPTPTGETTPSQEPTPAPTESSEPVTQDDSTNVIVVVDPGHGGRDPGTVSPYKENFFEKDITLDIALKLKEKLENAGIQVVMTRDTDKELNSYWKEDVRERPRIANRVGATFFVSIHVNSSDITKSNGATYNGTEIYHYGKTHGEFTSKQFAQMMGEEIDAVTDTKYNGVVKADLGVLRISEMPALLVETAYMTNKEDHQRLESQKFRDDMAQGILNGTIRILDTMGAYKEDGVYKMPKTNQ